MSSITSNLSGVPSNTAQCCFDISNFTFDGPPDVTMEKIRAIVSEKFGWSLQEITLVFKDRKLDDHLRRQTDLKLNEENPQDLTHVYKYKYIVNATPNSSSSSTMTSVTPPSPTPAVVPTASSLASSSSNATPNSSSSSTTTSVTLPSPTPAVVPTASSSNYHYNFGGKPFFNFYAATDLTMGEIRAIGG